MYAISTISCNGRYLKADSSRQQVNIIDNKEDATEWIIYKHEGLFVFEAPNTNNENVFLAICDTPLLYLYNVVLFKQIDNESKFSIILSFPQDSNLMQLYSNDYKRFLYIPPNATIARETADNTSPFTFMTIETDWKCQTNEMKKRLKKASEMLNRRV